MVRRYEPELGERRGGFVYWLAIVLIIMAWFFAFKLYFINYDNVHPDIAWAAPGMNKNTEAAEGVYLWDETLLCAPIAGKVYFPNGRGPVRVAFGQLVAKVVGENSTKEIRAFQQGYFIAGTDGKEGKWRYSLIWPDLEKLPEAGAVTMIEEGAQVAERAAIGKLIPQPQDVRFIGLVNSSSKLKEQLKHKQLKYMMDKEDTASAAEVSIAVETGGKIKFLAVLPCFNDILLKARRGKIVVETGYDKGAVVPASAVTERDGKKGVFLVRGMRVEFREVQGYTAQDGRFLVTQGIGVGDAVVEQAADAKEGRIQIW